MSVIDEIKNKAKANKKTVVLPETTDMRTLTAAAEVISEGIADIILVGKEDEIKAKAEGLDLSKASFVDPENCDRLNTYIESLCEARKSKGLLPEDAKEILLSNPLFFGATMVRVGDADGMVAGAINSSANVLRAALQVVKTAPGTEIVSAFMLMDTQAKDMGENGCFVFADCGLNQNPNPEQLAAIASSSAKTFEQLIGATPRVAMLSHSTCGSAKHDDVTKVVEATNIAKEKYPQYLICGELQLDAAIVPEVAASKAPRSEVAGKANVLVFPDLDAGNIGYKLVQRLGGAQAFGPITQGIAKPVNDLSRGCVASDIVGAVAITCVQAAALEADLCQIYTDVDGVYTADPRHVKGARKLDEVTYNEMLELATLGAQVLHNRSVEMAKRYNMNIEVLSSFTGAPGTIVKEAVKKVEKTYISGVAQDKNVARLAIVGLRDIPGVAFKVFNLLAREKINVDLIIQSIGRADSKDISFTVATPDADRAYEVIKDNQDALGFDHVDINQDVAKVSVVGGMVDNPGVAATGFEALYEAHINIKMISTSEIKVSVLIDKEDTDRAVAAIHAKFFG